MLAGLSCLGFGFCRAPRVQGVRFFGLRTSGVAVRLNLRVDTVAFPVKAPRTLLVAASQPDNHAPTYAHAVTPLNTETPKP